MKKYKSIYKRKRLSRKYVMNLRKKALLGIMNLLILQWIKKNPLCGQDIINKIFNEFDIKISSGTMYPILFSLIKYKLVSTKLKKKKKLYCLTQKGKKISGFMLKDYLKIQKDLKKFL